MPATEPLPVLRLFGDALGDVLGHLGGLARIAWPYYALAAVCLIGGFALSSGSTMAELIASLLGPGTASLVAGLAVLACTVKWQRHALLGEPLRGTAPLNGRAGRYALWSLVLGLLCAFPAAAAVGLGFSTGLIALDLNGAEPFGIGLPGIALLVAGAVLSFSLLARLAVFLPGISVDDGRLGLWRAWELTRGQGLRLLAVLALLALAVGLLGAAGSVLYGLAGAARGGPLVGAAVQMALDLLSGVFGASVTAGIYRHLVPVSSGST
ncbi:MAG: hypothetical protein ACJ8H8_23415 [Geminicoccaceae bacterium]